MQLGTARTGQFLIGNFEVRLADYRLAGHDLLTADHSVGVVDGFTLNFNTVRVEVLDGTPALIASQTVRQNVGVQFTFREFSARNWKLAMGGSPGWKFKQSWPIKVFRADPAHVAYIWIEETLANFPAPDQDNPARNLVLYPESGESKFIFAQYTWKGVTSYPVPDNYINVKLTQTREALGLPDFTVEAVTGWRLAFVSDLCEPFPDTFSPDYGPTPFLTLQLVQTDRETGANVVWDFWKVTVDGDFEMAVNNHEFSAGTVRFKTYDVTENDPLPALCQQYPLFRYYRPISSV